MIEFLGPDEKWQTTPTKFCSTSVPLWDGMSLYVDGNSKITAENGTMENPVPNAFSLPHKSTCPGATKACLATCYVHGLKKYSPEVYEQYEQNERIIHRLLMSRSTSARAAKILASFIEDTVTSFRWHVSGDVFSARYAEWIVDTCMNTPKTNFWIYTRSFELLDILTAAPNLAINVSADEDNVEEAIEAARYHGLRVFYESIDGTFPELMSDDVVAPDYSIRGIKGANPERPTDHPWWQKLSKEQRRLVCVADNFGQTENTRCGPCKICMRPSREGQKPVPAQTTVFVNR